MRPSRELFQVFENQLALDESQIKELQAEINRHKALHVRAADALSVWMPTLGTATDHKLIYELRKAAE